MSVALKPLYFATIRSNEPFPAGMEAAVLRSALKNPNSGLLEALAAYPHLSEESKEVLSKVPAAAVKAIWLSRSDITQAELEAFVKGEKRATVLAAVAAAEEATPALLSVLAKDERPSISWAVLENSKTPSSVAIDVFARLSKRGEKLGYEQRRTLHAFLESHPSIHSGVAEVVTDLSFLKLTLGSALSRKAEENIVHQGVVKAVAEVHNAYEWKSAELVDVVASVVFEIIDGSSFPEDLRIVAAKALLDIPVAYRKRNSRFTSEREHFLALTAGDESERAAAQALVDAAASRLERARVSSDLVELESLVSFFKEEAARSLNTSGYAAYYPRAPQFTSPLGLALLSNPQLPLSAAAEMLPFTALQDVTAFAERRIGLASTFQEYSFLAAATVKMQMEPISFMRKSKDPDQFLLVLIDYLNEDQSDRQRLYCLQRTLSFSHTFNDRVIMALPAVSVLANPAPRVAGLISEVLGDDPAAWETFEVLSGDFAGSFGDLISAAKDLS